MFVFRIKKDQFSVALPPWGVVKLFAMMSGELEYDATFHPDGTNETVKWAFLTKALFLVFIVMVTIVLQNLLIGLTISDIQVRNLELLPFDSSQTRLIFFF